MDHELRFDRRVRSELVADLVDGWLAPLVDLRNRAPTLYDLQFRRASGRDWISLYVGLSTVVSVDASRHGYRIRSHPTYRAHGFETSWGQWQSAAGLAAAWAGIERYIERVVGDSKALARLMKREGQVHPLMCSGHHTDYRVIQREAAISFPNVAARSEVVGRLTAKVHAMVTAAGRTDDWWPGVRDHGVLPGLGTKVDLIAVDDGGRLLVIEAKPPDAIEGIAWAPAQVQVYAALFAMLAERDGFDAVLNEMLAQRVEVGLTNPGAPVAHPVTVVPVVAIGAGPGSPMTLTRLGEVAAALDVGARFEVWLLDADGGVKTRWRPAVEPVPTDTVGAATRVGINAFVASARAGAEAWKLSTATLPAAARRPGPYRGLDRTFCLPLAFADHNLLPDSRNVSIERFADARIPWHLGVAGGPTNHLVSSQVQCANALGPFVDDPDALRRMFRTVLPIGEVLPFGADTVSAHDQTDHVVFEWTGLEDYLGEHPGRSATRGAHNTSADAAIRYRTPAGGIEVALIEWKYTEEYLGSALHGGETKTAVRRELYRPLFADLDGPLRTDLIPYEDLFVEPFYQLMRLQMLAWAMEQAHELGAEIVRLLVVAPSANVALGQSFNRPSQRSLGEGFGALSFARPETVFHAWRAMQRRPDRFTFLDSSFLVAPDSPVSEEFKARYGHIAVDNPISIATHDRLPADQVRQSAERALMVLRRVADDGGVITQLLSRLKSSVDRVDPVLLGEVTARMEELTELARRVRAEEICAALDQMAPAEPDRP
jgi:hypothetical protein